MSEPVPEGLNLEAKTALVTASRRYCLETAPELLPEDFDPAAFHLGESVVGHEGLEPDTYALERVLVACENVDVDRFSTFQDLQSHLVWLIHDESHQYLEFWDTRLDDGTRSVLDGLHRYIQGLSPDAVRDIKPLPYRRPLAQKEVWEIWNRVSERWRLPSGPPEGVDEVVWRRSNSGVFVSAVETFNRVVPPRVLRSVLQDLEITRVWKLDLPEERWSFEMDLAWVDTHCDWGECYWVPSDVGWIIYVSHEGELVVVGDALIEHMRADWAAG